MTEDWIMIGGKILKITLSIISVALVTYGGLILFSSVCEDASDADGYSSLILGIFCLVMIGVTSFYERSKSRKTATELSKIRTGVIFKEEPTGKLVRITTIGPFGQGLNFEDGEARGEIYIEPTDDDTCGTWVSLETFLNKYSYVRG